MMPDLPFVCDLSLKDWFNAGLPQVAPRLLQIVSVKLGREREDQGYIMSNTGHRAQKQDTRFRSQDTTQFQDTELRNRTHGSDLRTPHNFRTRSLEIGHMVQISGHHPISGHRAQKQDTLRSQDTTQFQDTEYNY